MNNKIFAALAAMSMIAVGGCGQPASPPSGNDAAAAAPSAANEYVPKYKADVSEEMLTPDSVMTKYAGELTFKDAFPTDETFKIGRASCRERVFITV